jgi:hypothetical protein
MGRLLARYGPGRVVAVAGAVVALIAVLVTATFVLSGESESPEAAAESAPTATSTATLAPAPTATPEASPTPILHAGILDGWPMSPEEWQARKDRLPLAVMVDNTAAAYPHAGLDRADVVYEAFVEGGITRLMAVFWRNEVEKVLPVRSARTPFVVWASELGAMYGHAGGAQTENDANALGQIIEWGVRDLNAFAPGISQFYYRDSERRGPYDLATSSDYLAQAAEAAGFAGPPAVESWLFREPGAPLPPAPAAGGIEIDFSGRSLNWQYIQWKWDSAQKRYLRSQFGREHLDAVTGQQLAFSTVIVMETGLRVVDEEGHAVLEQEGDGPATVFTGGMAFEGTWKKPNREARTRFYTADGAEIVFERGPIWIEVIGPQSRFAFSAEASDLPPMPTYELPPPGAFPTEPEETVTPEPTPTEQPAASTSTPSATSTPSVATPGSTTPGTGATPATALPSPSVSSTSAPQASTTTAP